jgi:hypothetical protein
MVVLKRVKVVQTLNALKSNVPYTHTLMSQASTPVTIPTIEAECEAFSTNRTLDRNVRGIKCNLAQRTMQPCMRSANYQSSS